MSTVILTGLRFDSQTGKTETYQFEQEVSDTVIVSSETDVKMDKLKQVRCDLFKETIWIKERQECEEYAITNGLRDAEGNPIIKTTITLDEYNQWLIYWRNLRDLPDTVNLKYVELEEIVAENTNLFGIKPAYKL